MTDGLEQPDTTPAPALLSPQRALALSRFAHTLAHTGPSLAEVLQVAAEQVRANMGVTCAVLLVGDDGETMTLAALAAANPVEESATQTMFRLNPLRVGQGISGRCVATRKAVSVSGLTPAAYAHMMTPEQIAISGAALPRAALAQPLVARGQVLGAMAVIHCDDQIFDVSDEAFSEGMADHLALALANARLVEALTASNAELQHTHAELRRTIAELDSFSSSVSHDLRGPVRAIGALVQIVIEEPGVELPEATLHLLDRIGVNAQRMGELIDDLLRLSRTGRHPLQLEEVDVSRLASEVALDIRSRREQPGVDVRIAPGLFAWADRRLLRIVLENLIDNAFKFTGRTERPLVEVMAEPPRTLVVQDNGVGFDPAHSARLFQPFQRLHTQRDFPGHGIGLATVRRIVDRHGGFVVGENRLEGGAVFRLSFPCPPEAGSPA